MNFLAHILLSGSSPQIIIGNFIGDAVKGAEYEKFPKEVRIGILLHRKIDQYTDCHPAFTATRSRLRPHYGKYSGVVADIFYDHFLASGWNQYHSEPLPSFASRIYALMEENSSWLPEKVQEFLPYMVRGNWLTGYAKIEGIKRTLEGMSRRAKFNSEMHFATNELIRDYDAYKADFQLFFPEIQEFSRTTLQSLREP